MSDANKKIFDKIPGPERGSPRVWNPDEGTWRDPNAYVVPVIVFCCVLAVMSQFGFSAVMLTVLGALALIVGGVLVVALAEVVLGLIIVAAVIALCVAFPMAAVIVLLFLIACK
jgi:hypothetical protein